MRGSGRRGKRKGVASRAPRKRRVDTFEYTTRRRYRIDPGRNAGAFSIVPRVPKVSNYERFGATHYTETFGSNSLNDVNYMGFYSVVPYELAKDVGISIIRYIMYKHYQVTYCNVADLLDPGWVSSSTDPMSITFYSAHKFINASTGAITQNTLNPIATFTFSNTLTVSNFGAWFALNVAANQVFSNLYEGESFLKSYSITHELGVSSQPEIKYYDISTMRVKAFCSATLRIQNSTLNDSGTTAVDVNNANPLKGKLYRFKDQIMQLREEGNYAGWDQYPELLKPDFWNYTATTSDGVFYPANNPTGTWRQPPPSHVFKNCVSTSNINLEPGEIKYDTIRFDFTGYLQDLLRGINYYESSTVSYIGMTQRKKFGTLHLFALEQMVRTGNTAILVNYQCDRTFGAYVIPPKPQIMRRYLGNITQVDNTGV